MSRSNRRRQYQPHPQQKAVVPPAQRRTKAMTVDMLVNQMARLGTADNLMAANEYHTFRLTQQYTLMDTLYRSDWIARRIIDTIPEDMTKNWFKLTCTTEPDQDARLENVVRRTHIRERLKEGLEWGRLYGGAAAVMMINGQEDMLDQPLDLRTIFPGDFKGLIVVDRWTGIYPSIEIVDNMDDPDVGLPEYYTVAIDKDQMSESVKVHHSRVLRFTGRSLPYIEKVMEQYWGMSELEHVFNELNKRNSVSTNIAQLVFNAHLRVFKMEDLGQNLAMTDAQSQEDLLRTLQAQNYLMNNMSLQIMSREDEFQTFDYTFSGLSDVYEQFMMDIAGAAEIPATKLFGRAPQGMNATGEGDLRNYYDTVKQNQEVHLRPILEKLLPVICLSAWGIVPDDLNFEFNPIRDTSDEERASLIQQQASAINSLFQSGLISQKTALIELRNAGAEYDMWTSITDETIDQADDSTNPEGEMGGMEDMMGMGGMMPGGEEEEQPPEQQMPPQEQPQKKPSIMGGMQKLAQMIKPKQQAPAQAQQAPAAKMPVQKPAAPIPAPQQKPHAPQPAPAQPQMKKPQIQARPQPQAPQARPKIQQPVRKDETPVQQVRKPSILARIFGRG